MTALRQHGSGLQGRALLAALAWASMALAPSLWLIARALDAQSWVLVCTVHGVQRAQYAAKGAPLPNPGEATVFGEVAPASKLPEDMGLAGPSDLFAFSFLASIAPAQPLAACEAPGAPPAWPPAHARAPPQQT